MIGELFTTNRITFFGYVEEQEITQNKQYTKTVIPTHQKMVSFQENEILLCVGCTETKHDYVYYSFAKNKLGWLRHYEVRCISRRSRAIYPLIT